LPLARIRGTTRRTNAITASMSSSFPGRTCMVFLMYSQIVVNQRKRQNTGIAG
jgi:hypothetical protein